jgi:CxxC-x17-CxxC domain-containing protein
MSDQQIQCSDCGNAFVFTEAERAFYDSKGLASPPKRCAPCRKARKLASPDRRPGGGAPGRGGSAGGWGRNGGGERGGGANGDRGGGGGRGGPRAPAEGRGWGKPSFSRSQGERPPIRPSFNPRARGPHLGENPPREAPVKVTPPPSAKAHSGPRPARPKFDITCGTCGTAAQVPFKPLEGREVFCQPCYRARRGLPPVDASGPMVDGLATDLAADKGESPLD